MADIVYIEQGYYIGDNYYTYTADAAATLNATTTVTCTITNVKTFACDFQTLFTPTLSATILKNHTAVLDVNATILVTISRIAGNQSTLDSIVTLSLQGDRGRTSDSTLPASFTQSTQIERIRNISSTQNTQFTITADATILGAAIEASATLTAEFTQSTQTSKLAATTVNLNTEFTVSVTAQRFRGIEKTFIGEVTIFTEIGLLQDAVCNFPALFTPTVVCVALKNHTAVLDAVSSLSCAITKTTGYVVSVNADSTVSVQASRTRSISETLNTEFNQTVTTIKTAEAASTFNIQFTQSTQVQKIKNAQSIISSQSSLTVTFITFVSKWYGTPRPNTWTRNSDGLVTFDGGIKKSNNYSLKLTSTKTTSSGTYGRAYTSGALGYISGDFLIEFWLYLDDDSSMSTGGAFGDQLPMLLWGANTTISIRTSVDGLTDGEEWGIGFDGQPGNAGGPPSSAGGRNIIAYAKTSSGIVPVTQSSTNAANSIIRSNTWYHVAFGRQSNVYKIYINGTLRSSDTTSYSGSLWFGRPTLINSSGVDKDNTSTYKGPVWIDGLSIRVGDFTRTGYSNNGLATNDYDYTFVLSDFENNFNDTLSLSLSGSATLNAQCTVSASAGKSVQTQATLNTLFTVSVIIGEIEPAEATLNSSASLSTTITKIKALAADLVTDAQCNTLISKITGNTADINTSTQLNVTVTRIKQFTTEFTAIAIELATVAKIGQGLLTLDVVAQCTTQANRTAAAESNLLTQFGITAQGARTRFGTASTQSEFSLNAVNSRIRALNSSLNAEFAVTASNSRIRGTQSTQNSTFSIICEPLPIKSAQSNQSAEFTQITTADRIRRTSVTFNTNFTQQSTGIIAVDAVAGLATAFTCAATILRIKSGVVAMAAIAVNLTAAAKTGAGLVTIESESQCTTTAQKTTDIQLNAVSTAQFASIIERIQQGVANIQSTFTQNTNGVLSTDVVANMNTLFSTTVTAQKTVSVNVNISSAGGFVMAVAAIRNGEILLNTQATIAATVRRIRGTGAGLNNSFTVIALAGKAAVAQCAMNVTVTHNITAGVLRLDDIVLYIKTETRSYSINNEQRSYAIRTENRLYTIEE